MVASYFLFHCAFSGILGISFIVKAICLHSSTRLEAVTMSSLRHKSQQGPNGTLHKTWNVSRLVSCDSILNADVMLAKKLNPALSETTPSPPAYHERGSSPVR